MNEEREHEENGHDPGFDDEPTVEDVDEVRLGPRLWYLQMLMRRADAEQRRDRRRVGGFRGQGRVLRLLALQSPIAQKELTYLLGIRSQSLAEQLAKLEEENLIERHPNPRDRRTSMVELTEAGRMIVDDEGERTERDPFRVLPEEDERLLADLLDRLIEGMEANLVDGPDPRMEAFKEMAFDPDGDWPDFGGRFGGGRGRRGPGGPGGPGGHRRRGGWSDADGFDDDHPGGRDGDGGPGRGGRGRGRGEARGQGGGRGGGRDRGEGRGPGEGRGRGERRRARQGRGGRFGANDAGIG